VGRSPFATRLLPALSAADPARPAAALARYADRCLRHSDIANACLGRSAVGLVKVGKPAADVAICVCSIAEIDNARADKL
jgi:hypothetical protein